MSKAFGSRELIKVVERLGFYTKDFNRRHIKYYHKGGKTGSKSFIMIQAGRKNYGKNACNRYIQQLEKFGFSKGEIEKLL